MKKADFLSMYFSKIYLQVLLFILVTGCSKNNSEQQNETLPLINAVSPLQGIPGDTISITGSNFGNSLNLTTVKFNGTSSTVVNVTEATIKAIVPSSATTGKISVSIGGKTATSGTDFTVLSYVTTLAGNGTADYADGMGMNASFKYATDLVVDTSGNVYVADASNFRIRKINPQGVVTTLAGSGVAGFTDGNGTVASFGTMMGLAIDKLNNFLYVADLGNHSIRKVSLSGTVTTLAGGSLPDYIDGTVNTAKFHLPMGVAVDDLNNIFVADAGNNCIRMISNAGIVTTIAGSTTAGNIDGSGSSARFKNPIKIKIKSSGDLVVLDQLNHSIRLVKSNGIVSTIAGTGIAGFADGGINTAQFNAPAGLCLDNAGNIYIGDQLNQRIRKISTQGAVTTIAGTGVSGYLDGATTIAKFYHPNGLDITTSGNIYVVDNQNHRIRVIKN